LFYFHDKYTPSSGLTVRSHSFEFVS